jgi:hypothetical protein
MEAPGLFRSSMYPSAGQDLVTPRSGREERLDSKPMLHAMATKISPVSIG